MLLNYDEDQHLIVFDHLAPPDKKMKGKFDTYGPDLTYDGYRFKDGRWAYVENLDLRNKSGSHDEITSIQEAGAIDKGYGELI